MRRLRAAAASFAAGMTFGAAARSPWCPAIIHAAASTSTASATDFDYDIVVIGGGSGGLAAAKQAAENGARVALCDFVTPTSHGTKWGLGGTCVNVGCIPKKIMHYTALQRHERLVSPAFGFPAKNEDATAAGDVPEGQAALVDWAILQANTDMYIRSLNFGYASSLRSKKVKYLNARASFLDPHTLSCVNQKGETVTVTAKTVIVAVGCRPTQLSIPGGEVAITSDDLFRRPVDPGSTLVVGSGVVGLECAGMLHGIGRRATVMMRSIPLRGYDEDMARRVLEYMEEAGVGVIRGTVPSAIRIASESTPEKPKYLVDYTDSTSGAVKTCGPFDTVLYAAGRKPLTSELALDRAGVKVSPKTGKIVVDAYEATSQPSVFAIGDVADGRPELTPPAIQSGILLANRLVAATPPPPLHMVQPLDYSGVPMTVFTPLEYSFVGMTEEEARSRLPSGQLETYHANFLPLEWSLSHQPPNTCYMKLLVDKATDRVVGFHLLAPNAGEVTQGVAVALRAGATKAMFDTTIGIHPTVAETMTSLSITKASGRSPAKEGC